MGTKVSTLSEYVGVECPKKTGKMMDESKSCKECEKYEKCLTGLNKFMGWSE